MKISKSLGLTVIVLFLAAGTQPLRAQQSLQALHTRIPAPPLKAAAAPAWLSSAEVSTLRKQIAEQRAFVEKLDKQTSEQSTAAASNGPVDFARAQRDPEYARQLQEKLQKMTQAEQLAFAMEMQKAQQAQAVRDVQLMVADPEPVTRAAERYADYQTSQMLTDQVTAQIGKVADLQREAQTQAMHIAARAEKKLRCSDGEGSCSAADRAADKATLRAAHAEIVTEYDRALAQITQHVAAARQARAATIAAAQRDLAPAGYGAAAKSAANRQLLAAYHNAVLIEVEQLFELSEDTAKWAANRVNDRTINFMPID